jgi:hypothetical protein
VTSRNNVDHWLGYAGHVIEVLEDGRWRFQGLTFETAADCRYYIDHLPKED